MRIDFRQPNSTCGYRLFHLERKCVIISSRKGRRISSWQRLSVYSKNSERVNKSPSTLSERLSADLLFRISVRVSHMNVPQGGFLIRFIIDGATIVISTPRNLQRAYRSLRQLRQDFGRWYHLLVRTILLYTDNVWKYLAEPILT